MLEFAVTKLGLQEQNVSLDPTYHKLLHDFEITLTYG